MHPVTVISGSSACRRTLIPLLTLPSLRGYFSTGYPYTHVIEWRKTRGCRAGGNWRALSFCFQYNISSSFWLEWHPPRPVHNVWRIHCLQAMERSLCLISMVVNLRRDRRTLRNSYRFRKQKEKCSFTAKADACFTLFNYFLYVIMSVLLPEYISVVWKNYGSALLLVDLFL